MKDIKIIFFDIDGTLIAMDQDTISEKTLEALKRLQEKGVKLCLATGRGPMLIPHFEGVEFDAFLTMVPIAMTMKEHFIAIVFHQKILKESLRMQTKWESQLH